jgi:hypothetical protein
VTGAAQAVRDALARRQEAEAARVELEAAEAARVERERAAEAATLAAKQASEAEARERKRAEVAAKASTADARATADQALSRALAQAAEGLPPPEVRIMARQYLQGDLPGELVDPEGRRTDPKYRLANRDAAASTLLAALEQVHATISWIAVELGYDSDAWAAADAVEIDLFSSWWENALRLAGIRG